MFAATHRHAYMCMWTRAHTRTPSHTCSDALLLMSTHAHTYIVMPMQSHIAYLCTCTHTHTCMHTPKHMSVMYFFHVSKGMAFARLVEDHVYLEQHRELNTKQLIFAVRSSLALSLSTWLNLSRSTSLLGLRVLPKIELFASPPSKNNNMVVVPFCSSAAQIWNSPPVALRHSLQN